MKKSIILFFLITSQLYCQSYMNFKYTDASYKYAAINEISEITFNASGTVMTVALTNGSSNTDALSTISEMTFDSSILGGGGPLPVELVSFTVALTNSEEVVLNWQTATEVNNYGFSIERFAESLNSSNSVSTINWETIGFVEGHGNSNAPKEYSYTDKPTGACKIQYRLKQIDTDGKFEYSDILEVEIAVPTKFELAQNYPNPFNPTTVIDYSLNKASNVTLRIYNSLGEEAKTLVNEHQVAGKYYVTFNASKLSSGIYFYSIRTDNNASIKKMILLK